MYLGCLQLVWHHVTKVDILTSHMILLNEMWLEHLREHLPRHFENFTCEFVTGKKSTKRW